MLVGDLYGNRSLVGREEGKFRIKIIVVFLNGLDLVINKFD